MSLLGGCFGYCHRSKKRSNRKSKDTTWSSTSDVQTPCSQITPKKEVSKKKTKKVVLSRPTEIRNWPLFKLTACSFFFRNFNTDRQFFQALKREGLLVTMVSSVTSPVLNIAWFFTHGDLTNTRQSFHSSFQKSYWDVVIYEGVTEEMKASINYDRFNEPILDGIPCSQWLEVIEPTIPMILDLFSKRHRKTNLSRLRDIDRIYDDFITRHGDTFFEQLDPNMYGPQQVLVNRIHHTPFPTMELGAAAALVHNAIVSREHQFQEPFRSRRPHHRSRCTTRPRSLSSPRGCSRELAPELDITLDYSTASYNSTAPALCVDQDNQEMVVDTDPHWYVPVLLDLAEFSQIQFPDFGDSSEDVTVGSSGIGVESVHIPEVSTESYDDETPGCSGIDAVYFQTQPSNDSTDSSGGSFAGCSRMGARSFYDHFPVHKTNSCSGSNVLTQSSQSSFTSEKEFLLRKSYPLNVGSGFLTHKSEIDKLFSIDENASEGIEALSEMVEDGNINGYVDFILENAVIALTSNQGSSEKLLSGYGSAVDVTDLSPLAPSESPSDMAGSSGMVSTSTRYMNAQRTQHVPSPNVYKDECVVDEMALMNLNQSASLHKDIGRHRDICLNVPSVSNLDQINLVTQQTETVVPQTSDHLSRDLAMLNVNQSARRPHKHHGFRSRCECSADTWSYHVYENIYEPEKLRPDESALRTMKASIRTYLRRMSEANIRKPTIPAIIRILDGTMGPVGRRLFVRSATELLNEIDEKEPEKWIPTTRQRWEFRNRPEVSCQVELADTAPKSTNRQRNSTTETTKKKTKRRHPSKVSKNKERRETSRTNADSTGESADDPTGNCQSNSNRVHIKTDVKRKMGIERESQDRVKLSDRSSEKKSTIPACEEEIEKRECEFNEKTQLSENEHFVEVSKMRTSGKSEKLTNSNRNQKNLKTRSCQKTTRGDTTCRIASTNEQTCVSECENGQINVQPSASSKEMKCSPENCVTLKDETETNVQDVPTSLLSPYPGNQRRLDGPNKYESSTNDADSSSSDCNDEPKRKSKVRWRKRRSDTIQRKETLVETGPGSGGLGNNSCYLSNESKQILEKMKHDDTPKNLESDDESSCTENGVCEPVSECCDAKTSRNVDKRQEVCGNKDQVKGSVVWEFSDAEMSWSSSCEITDEDEYDTDCTDRRTENTSSSTDRWTENMSLSTDRRTENTSSSTDRRTENTSSSTSLENSSCETDITDHMESSSVDYSDSYWTGDEEFSYDTDASISGYLNDDEDYVMVNISDTFHSISCTSNSSEQFTDPHITQSSRWENRRESGSACSLEYSPRQQGDCTSKSPPLCCKSAKFYGHNPSDTYIDSLLNRRTSTDKSCNGKHSPGDNASDFALSDHILGSVDTPLRINDRTSASVFDTRNESASGETRDESLSCAHSSPAEIQEPGSHSSKDDERPVKLRFQQARGLCDVGDHITSLDDVRRRRESRRQRGMLQYQWNGMHTLAYMYVNAVGPVRRRQTQQFRAWLDRRRRRLQRNN